MNSSYWAILSNAPLILQYYTWNGSIYYKIPDQGYYMSISRNAYVGFYGWNGASTFHKDGRQLVSDYNNQKLSYYSDSDRYLYCWNDYTVFDVEFVDQKE